MLVVSRHNPWELLAVAVLVVMAGCDRAPELASSVQAIAEHEVGPLDDGTTAAVASPESDPKLSGQPVEMELPEAVSLTVWVESLGGLPDLPRIANNLAWTLATHPSPWLREAPTAVWLARFALSSAQGPPAHYLDTIAAAYASGGEFEHAARILREVLERPDVRPEHAAELAQRLALYESEQVYYEEPAAAALAELKEADELAPRASRFLLLALLLEANSYPGEAAKTCQQALTDNAREPLVHRVLGRLARQMGNDRAAAFHFRIAVEERPDDAVAAGGLAVAETRLGNPAGAVAVYRRLLAAGQATPQTANNFVWLLATSGEASPQVISAGRKLAEQLVASSDPPQPGWLDTLAAVQAREGDFAAAVATMERAIAGLAQSDAGKLAAFRLRREMYEAGLSYHSQTDAHVQLGYRYLAAGEAELAVKHLTQARGELGNDADLIYTLGCAYHRCGRMFEAAECMALALQLRPGFTDAVNNIAWILATHEDDRLRRPEAALRMAKQLCESSQHRQPRFLDTLAAAYAAAGRFDEAAATVTQALRHLGPDDSEDFRQALLKRQELYRAGKPYRG